MTPSSRTALRIGLVVPDAAIRRGLIALIDSDPLLQLTLIVEDPRELLDALRRTRPDLLILAEDLGSTSLTRTIGEVMSIHPMPVVVAADAPGDPSEPPSSAQLDALRAGALTVVPSVLEHLTDHQKNQLLLTLHDMSAVKVVRKRLPLTSPAQVTAQRRTARPEVIGIAASSGGPAALHQILIELPADFPTPILVVQHFTAGFLTPFVRWLNHDTHLDIRIAQQDEPLQPATVYIAPDHFHLGAHEGRIALCDDAPIGGFRPSANHLFASLAEHYGSSAWGIILTGIKRDGADGLMEIRRRGAVTIAQHKQDCAVYGMPRAARESGAAIHALTLTHLHRHLLDRRLPPPSPHSG